MPDGCCRSCEKYRGATPAPGGETHRQPAERQYDPRAKRSVSARNSGLSGDTAGLPHDTGVRQGDGSGFDGRGDGGRRRDEGAGPPTLVRIWNPAPGGNAAICDAVRWVGDHRSPLCQSRAGLQIRTNGVGQSRGVLCPGKPTPSALSSPQLRLHFDTRCYSV